MEIENADQLIQESLARLALLVGEWTGQGRAVYPTIETSQYRERLTFKKRVGMSTYFIYEQATDLIDEKGQVIRKSHWESGLVRPMANGILELACVQAGGRLEVLQGKFVESDPGTLKLRFESKEIVNDERMKSSAREWTVTDKNFSYVQEMSTTKVDAPTIHLEAALKRV